MPSDLTGFFRNYEVDTDSTVKAVSNIAEDSVQQYSRVKAQRIDEARKQIEQKQGKSKYAEDKENIEVTISEDLADGHGAKLDAYLKLLSDDDIKLLLPTDELEDDEIHIIQTTNVAPRGNNHALQDYQMQLMLLEQQNKKRLIPQRSRNTMEKLGSDYQVKLMHLEEQNKKRLKSIADEWDRTEKQIGRRAIQLLQPQIRLGAAGEPSSALGAGHVKKNMHTNGAHKDVASTEKRQKLNSRARPQLDLQDHPGLANGEDSKNVDVGSKEAIPLCFDLLYSVICTTHDSSEHPFPAFRDMPIPNAGGGHLNGRIPVFNIGALLEENSDDAAFIIVRTVECSEASVFVARTGGLLQWTEDIYMKSKVLKVALQQIATCYFQPAPNNENRNSSLFNRPQTSSMNETPLSQSQIVPADLFLFHHREALGNYVEQHIVSTEHIGALLEYTESRFGSAFAAADESFANGLVTQAHILHLFKPNELVIGGTYGKPAAFVLQQWPEISSDGWVTLQCWSFQTDGSGFARKSSVILLPPVGETPQKIQDLIAYPLRFAAPELREMIRSRGEKHWQHRTATQVTYKGWNVRKDQFFPDARFMIDHSVYHKMHEFARAFHFTRPSNTFPYDRLPAYLDIEQEPSETSFLLMPPDIHGFYLNEKKWIQLFIDCVHPVTWNKKAFERLVLPPPTKDLVRALVTVRKSQRGVMQGLGVAGKRADITSGKGNGLIMLLHGGPGTGKTLTGESVAEIAEMPLYRVTCGDIGTSAEAVEKYLNAVLHLGKIWNCVLLLDEADIFLEERSMADLKRNSIVSVFLRILEYYDGILILTSNRVGMFDEAFKSRIQVALHYEKLNRSARRRIWQNFLDMLEEDGENVNFEGIKLHLDDLTERDLNGRQIRNVLTTARQLAIFKNERLDWEHLEQALSVSADFHKYLQRLQGHTDEQRATDIGLR